MKIFYTLIAIALLNINAFGQVPQWQWANSGGGIGQNDETTSVATDALGNVYICGRFYSVSISIGATTLTNADILGTTPDVFIAKYNSAGTLLWAKSAGGTQGDEANSIATDASGNVFICGYYQSSSIVFGTTTLNNTGTGYDYFLVKYDSSGNELWAKEAGGTGYEQANAVATDAAGNAYITGQYTSAAFSVGSTTLSNGGSQDLFLAKYDGSGNVLWAKCANGLYIDVAHSITIDVTGNVYITGEFSSNSLVFGMASINHSGSTNTFDILTAKYTSAGTFVWAKKVGGTTSDAGYSVKTDATGNVYVAGYYSSASIVFGTSTLTMAGGFDFLILKYDSSGNELFAISAGAAGYELGSSIAIDALGNLFLAGGYQQSSLTVGATTLTNAGGGDGFLIKYDATGTPLWATSVGYDLNDGATAVTIDASGDIYLTGSFQSYQIYLGSFLLPNSAPSGASADFFLGKMNSTLVSISEINNKLSDFILYPNPFNFQTTIAFSEEQKNTSIKIINLLGEEIRTINFNGKQLVIDKGEMKAGVYFVQTTDEKKNVTNKKIIIQ